MKKVRVLFLCTGNSARSQMAEGMLRHFVGDKFEVYSAGTHPTNVNPYAIKVMSELGIDISSQKSKHVKEFVGQQFDFIITVCDYAKQTCPFFPGENIKIHWSLPDPANFNGSDEDKLAFFRKTRDEIQNQTNLFIKQF